jgi:hypothetical protein
MMANHVQIAMLFATKTWPTNLAVLTVMVTAANRKMTVSPICSLLCRKFRPRMSGNGMSKTEQRVSVAICAECPAILLNSSEVILSAQFIFARGIDANVEQAVGSLDLKSVISNHFSDNALEEHSYQLTDTFAPHQKVSANRVIRLEQTTNAMTPYKAFRRVGTVDGTICKKNASILNFGK